MVGLESEMTRGFGGAARLRCQELACGNLFLKALAAKDRPAAPWRVKGTVVSDPHSAHIKRVFSANRLPGVMIALRAALFAVFRVIQKFLVAKEDLLTSRKQKRGSAFHALQLSVNKIHTISRHTLAQSPVAGRCEAIVPGGI